MTTTTFHPKEVDDTELHVHYADVVSSAFPFQCLEDHHESIVIHEARNQN